MENPLTPSQDIATYFDPEPFDLGDNLSPIESFNDTTQLSTTNSAHAAEAYKVHVLVHVLPQAYWHRPMQHGAGLSVKLYVHH